MHNGPGERPIPETRKNFLTRFTYETFEKKIPYTEDLYETKEELIKKDYVDRRNLILDKNNYYITTVKQRGCFYPEKTTYGVDREFPEVRIKSIFILSVIENPSCKVASTLWSI